MATNFAIGIYVYNLRILVVFALTTCIWNHLFNHLLENRPIFWPMQCKLTTGSQKLLAMNIQSVLSNDNAAMMLMIAIYSYDGVQLRIDWLTPGWRTRV